MDHFGLPDRTCATDESDLKDLFDFQMELDLRNHSDDSTGGDTDISEFDSPDLDLESYMNGEPEAHWINMLDQCPIVNDKMMSEAMDTPGPIVKSEHSYSVGRGTSMEFEALDRFYGQAKDILKVEDTGTHVVEVDTLLEQPAAGRGIVKIALPQPVPTLTVVKQKPRNQHEPIVIETRRPQQSLLKPHTILVTRQPGSQTRLTHLVPKQQASARNTYTIDQDEGIYLNVMPMTPPSSSSSDGEHSPLQSPTASPVRQYVTRGREVNPATAIYSQPIPTSGVLVLTEEEKRTLISEGYPIPSNLPLTKIEERNLKKVRRKIKNKISAQESRRKRKEYLDQLEKEMENINKQNSELKKKCEQYQQNNSCLTTQLNKLQNIMKRISPQNAASAAQSGVCLMVLVLCFAVFFGHWSPSFSWLDGLTAPEDLTLTRSADSFSHTTLKGSRTLLSMYDEERSCGNEPWPLMLARKSFQSISSLITGEAVGEATVHSNGSGQPVLLPPSLNTIHS